MTDITFVKTRHEYDTYRDFFKLVELANFPIIYTDEVDISEHKTFITSPMNGEWRPHIDNQVDRQRNAHLVLWNIERPSGSAGSVGQYAEANRDLIYQRHVDEVWVSDRRLAQETELRYVVLGSHPDFGEISNGNKQYDVIHLSYETGRRQSIYKHFNNVAPNSWPPERDEILKQSKFALNVHQDMHPFIEPLRLALFAAYGIPVVSETIYDSYPYGDETMIYSYWDGLVGKMKQILDDDYQRFADMGLRAREMMTNEFEFGKMVRQAVGETLERWR